jgi:O-antigen/teichoic acid export membrane protein
VTKHGAPPALSEGTRSYGRGAAILSVGIGATGLIAFAYFSLASYALEEAEYGRITLLWSAVFITVSVLYRPIEQLLSRTIADRDARGVAVLAYAASYFARGFLAGHHRFGLYGGLVLMEASSRCLFALAVAVGIAEGETAVALGMAAAPIVSLGVVVPWAIRRRLRAQPPSAPAGAQSAALDAAARDEPAAGAEPEFTLARGSGFAVAVLLVMLSEQTFLNAGPLLVEATEGARGAALAGFTFNVLLIARAPLQLFQAVQASILPHLTRMRASGETDPFRRSVNLTLVAISAFAACVALVMLAVGPLLMDLLFGGEFDYERGGLVLVSLGMGLYLAAATLNQALLAHGRARQAAAAWAACAAAFALFLLLADFDDRVLQVELAFLGAAAALCALLHTLYRRA